MVPRSPLFRLLLAFAFVALGLPREALAANLPQLFSVSVTPASADVSYTDQQVTVTLRVTAVDGLTSGSASLQLANGTGSSFGFPLDSNARVSGDQYDGTYSAAVSIPRGTPAGTYLLKVSLFSGSSGTVYGQYSLWPGGSQPSVSITDALPGIGPVIQSIDISPAAIDVTTADQTVTYTLRITAADGLRLIDAWGTGDGQTNYVGPTLILGDATNGVYRFTRTFPRGFASQVDVPHLELYGNNPTSERIYSATTPASQWPGGIVPALTITDSLPDTSGPVLVSCSITPGPPDAIDLSAGDATAVLTLHITDDVRGFSSGNITYWPDEDTIHNIQYLSISYDPRRAAPQPPMTVTVHFSDADRISGTPQDGMYQKQFVIPKYLLSTGWMPISLGLSDGYHFSGSTGIDYSNARINSISTPGYISFSVANSQPDFSAPALISAAASPSVISTSTHPTQVTVTAAFTDDSLGFASATGVLRNAQGDEIPIAFSATDLVSGTTQNGTYATTVTVPAGTSLGAYDLVLSVTDGAYTASATKTAVLAIDNQAPTVGQIGFLSSLNPYPGGQPLSSTTTVIGTMGGQFYLGGTFADDALGFASASGVFVGPNGDTIPVSFTASPATKVQIAGAAPTEIGYAAIITVPPYSAGGDWVLDSLTLSDGANSRTAQGKPHLLTFHVSNDVSLSVTGVKAINTTSATLHQVLYPNGAGDFTVALDYGIGAFDQSTAPVAYLRSTDPLDVDISLANLSPNRTYQARAKVTGPGGVQYGEAVSFTTPPGEPPVPSASSADANGTHINVTFTDAEVGGQVYIEYGPTNSYGSATTPVAISESGPRSFALETLSPHGSYVYRLVLKNAAGIAYGAEQSLAVANLPPVATADAGAFHGMAGSEYDVLANDSDPDGDTLTITAVTGATHGQALIQNNQIGYASNRDGDSTPEALTYTISDGHGGTAQGTLTLTPQNHSPVAPNLHFVRHGAEDVVIDALAVSSDPDQDSLTYSRFSEPANGHSWLENNKIMYRWIGPRAGLDRFTYTIIDGAGGEATGTIDVVNGDNASGLTYNGLLHAPDAPAEESIGYLSVRTLARQSYTGVLLFEGERFSFAGKAGTGTQEKTFRSTTAGRLTLDFTLDAAAEQLSGTLNYGPAGATVSAQFAFEPIDALANLPSVRYTAAFGPPSSGPYYSGYAAITSAADANLVRIIGRLSDGSGVSASGGLVNHALPLYAILTPARAKTPGTLSGNLAFNDSPSANGAISGTLSLVPATIGQQPASAAADSSYLLDVQGSTYLADRLSPPLEISGAAVATSADFTHSWTVRFAAPNRIIATGADARMLSLSFDLASGVFQGSITASKGHRYPVAGVVLRDRQQAIGFFQSAQDGSFTITSQATP